jgi:tetratricopeptide (TPR) repeat protein
VTGVSIVEARSAQAETRRAEAVKAFMIETYSGMGKEQGADASLRKTPARLLLEHAAATVDGSFAGDAVLQAELHGIMTDRLIEFHNFRLAEVHARRRMTLLDQLRAPVSDRADAATALTRIYVLGPQTPEECAQVGEAAVATAGKNRWAVIRARLQLIQCTYLSYDRIAYTKSQMARLEADLDKEPDVPSVERAKVLDLRAVFMASSVDTSSDAELDLRRRGIAMAVAVEGPFSSMANAMRQELFTPLVLRSEFTEATQLAEKTVEVARLLGGEEDPVAAFDESYFTASLFVRPPDRRFSFADVLAIIEPDRVITHQFDTDWKARSDRRFGDWADFWLGWCYLSWHDFEQGATLMRTLVDSLPQPVIGWVWLYRLLAEAEGLRGHHDEAERLLRKAIRAESMGIAVAPSIGHRLLGEELTRQGRFDEAEQELDAVVDDPRRPDLAARAQVARVSLAIERQDFSKAWSLLPEPAVAALLIDRDDGHRGEILCETGRPAEGLPLLEEWIATVAPKHWSYSPIVARVRAIAGLCALAAGDEKHAAELAVLADDAFAHVSEVNPYFKRPWEELHRARPAFRHRRGGGERQITLDTRAGHALASGSEEILQVDEALARLARAEPRLAKIVELRYFGGYSDEEIAELFEMTSRTVRRDWKKARMPLAAALQ